MQLPSFNLKSIPGLGIYQGLTPKHRKYANLLIGGIVAVMVMAAASWVMDKGSPTPPPPQPKSEPVSTLSAPGAKVDPQQYWMATQAKRLDRQEELLKKLLGSKGFAASDVEAAGPESAASAASAPASAKGVASPASAVAGGAGATATSSKGEGSNQQRLPKQPGPNAAGDATEVGGVSVPFGRGKGNGRMPPAGSADQTAYPGGTPNGGAPRSVGYTSGAQSDAPAAVARPGIVSVQVSSPEEASGEASKLAKAERFNVKTNFLPVGFVRARLMGGIDAATGGQAQSDPQPVLFLLEDDSILPNGWRGKIRNCFVVGAGFGELSSERAFIRLVNLSCVLKSGQVLEAKAIGSAFGDDGKNGLRGRLISKQGQVLANAALAGIAAGIGQGFGNSGTTTTTSPLGVTQQQSTDAKVVLNNSVARGFGNAMDRLAQYWIERADKMFPIIEIDANRTVDLLFTKGIQVDAMPGGGDAENEEPRSTRNLDRRSQAAALIMEP